MIDNHDIVVAGDLATLIKGAHGDKQPARLRPKLLEYERSGYIAYLEDKGWSLTESGAKLVREMRKLARRYGAT